MSIGGAQTNTKAARGNQLTTWNIDDQTEKMPKVFRSQSFVNFWCDRKQITNGVELDAEVTNNRRTKEKQIDCGVKKLSLIEQQVSRYFILRQLSNHKQAFPLNSEIKLWKKRRVKIKTCESAARAAAKQ